MPVFCPSLFCFDDGDLAMLQSDAYAQEAKHDRDVLLRVLQSIRTSDWVGRTPPSSEEWLWAVGVVLSRQFARERASDGSAVGAGANSAGSGEAAAG